MRSSVTASQAGQSIGVNLGNDAIASPLADSQGSWTAKFTVPEIPAGNRLVTVKTTDGEMKIPFLVSAGISLSATRTSPANLIAVSGAGFGASERGIKVTVGQVTVAAGYRPTSAAHGAWTSPRQSSLPDHTRSPPPARLRPRTT